MSHSAGVPDIDLDRYGALRARIGTNRIRIGIIGLGYVGLPLALAYVRKGLSVLGFDIDPAKVETLGRGESDIGYISGE